MDVFDFINRDNADYIEQLYQQYQKDPRSLDAQWTAFFAGFELGYGRPAPAVLPTEIEAAELPDKLVQGVYGLVNAYRGLGHFIAHLDPLGHNRTSHPLLELSEFGLSTSDLDRQVGAGGFLGPTDGTLRDLVEKLRSTYCRTLGVQYMDIADKDQRTWLQEQMEPILNRPLFSASDCHHILSLLIAAEEFEHFLHTKYIGHKRFSIEGSEALLPLLDSLLEVGADGGVEEIVMGMTHRGRLNVLAHLLHKPYEIILSEFEGMALPHDVEGDGDVKYHLGYSYDHVASSGRKIHLSLSSNPSHLELIDPVMEGMVHAKQDYLNDTQRRRVVPIQIHGEAAFTGQGIVPETLRLSELKGYHTGGTIHIIINNQVGFTATPEQTRFTPYPTDVAKMIQAPVFHVNADDPEAVVHAARLAMEFRQQFRMDVMIDLWCYRRYGHNEADDPTFTQPLMYKEIDELPSICELYTQRLIEADKIGSDDAEEIRKTVRQRLDDALEIARELHPRQRMSTLEGVWKGFTRAGDDWSAETAVNLEMLQKVAQEATHVPAGFSVNRKLKRLLPARVEMIKGEEPVDWGCAEMLAFGSLLLEGIPVRLTGEDSERGTFSQRHAVWHDAETGDRYVPLTHLAEGQAPFTVLNTMLSELSVLGFEYGISSADPRRLVLWEAQFGDFANGAQLIIDQFISSAESKWQRYSGLTLLLPHGYEGQGPEHSSARLERFLQLCAENNMQVCYPTVPAQYFHALRRQMHRTFRKPLILMTPKSLLRHKRSTSPIEDLTEGEFQSVIDDPAEIQPDRVRRLILCTGKIYFDLLEGREERDVDEVALVRVEQLYPFPKAEIQSVLKRYKGAKEVYWVQEEPQNMGAWFFMEPRLRQMLSDDQGLSYRGREEASSPATGSLKIHQIEQEEIIAGALKR